MAQLVTAILANQDDLAAKARQFFADDVNEASLLVGRVISRAFGTLDHDASADAVSRLLRHDLDRMIEQRRLT